jgi:hypothetical protein
VASMTGSSQKLKKRQHETLMLKLLASTANMICAPTDRRHGVNVTNNVILEDDCKGSL